MIEDGTSYIFRAMVTSPHVYLYFLLVVFLYIVLLQVPPCQLEQTSHEGDDCAISNVSCVYRAPKVMRYAYNRLGNIHKNDI